MAKLYEIIVYGSPDDELLQQLLEEVTRLIEPFGLELGKEIAWTVNPVALHLSQTVPAAAVVLNAAYAPAAEVLIGARIPILPIVPNLARVNELVPEGLRHLNCLGVQEQGVERAAGVLLETLNLLPRQRRVFLSYKRDEAREAAIQLADALANRQFEVFLDTRGVPPGEDFQAQLWHKLCDCDVLLMLHTPGYFSSRWTSAEFGRALAKHIPVLNVTWPDDTPDKRTQTAARAELLPEEVDADSGRISDGAIDRIARQLERLRAASHAVRNINLVSRLAAAVQQVGGRIRGRGWQSSIYVELADGRVIHLFPNVGVPTSAVLHWASSNRGDADAAVAYDEIGMLTTWIEHLDWLGQHITGVRWIKASSAAWQFSDWRP